MGTKKVKYNKNGISKLPNDKPVIYRIETEGREAELCGHCEAGACQGSHKGASP